MIGQRFTQIAPEAIPPRLSVIGYVKVGGKEKKVRWSKGQKSRPYTLPERYAEPARFEVTTREQDLRLVEHPSNKRLKEKVSLGYKRDEAIHSVIGTAPTRLAVRLMFKTWEENFLSHFGAHDGRRWVCRGNGLEAEDVDRGEVPCTCPRLKQFDGEYSGPAPQGGAQCKPRGVLSVILDAEKTFGGFRVFKTTSYESIANIRTQLQVFQEQFKRLDGLPFEMMVYPATKSYGEGVTTQPIVTILLAASFDTARQIGVSSANRQRLLLASAGNPDPETVRQVLEREMEEEAEAEGSEFFPDAGGKPEGPTMAERLERRAKAKGSPLPVVQGTPAAKATDDGPDFEVVEDEDEEEAGADQEKGKAEAAGGEKPKERRKPEESAAEKRARWDGRFMELAKEQRPDWGTYELALFGDQHLGKAKREEWSEEDYLRAVELLKSPEISITVPDPPARTKGEPQGDLLGGQA